MDVSNECLGEKKRISTDPSQLSRQHHESNAKQQSIGISPGRYSRSIQ